MGTHGVPINKTVHKILASSPPFVDLKKNGPRTNYQDTCENKGRRTKG